MINIFIQGCSLRYSNLIIILVSFSPPDINMLSSRNGTTRKRVPNFRLTEKAVKIGRQRTGLTHLVLLHLFYL